MSIRLIGMVRSSSHRLIFGLHDGDNNFNQTALINSLLVVNQLSIHVICHINKMVTQIKTVRTAETVRGSSHAKQLLS